MSHPITTETEKLFGTGNNYEERRGKVISVNSIDGLGTTEPDKEKTDGVGDIEEGELEKKSDVK